MKQIEFPFARIIDTDREIDKHVDNVVNSEEHMSIIDNYSTNFFSWFYKAGFAGLGAYFTWRTMGGEAPSAFGEGWENGVAFTIKYSSFGLILLGLGTNYFLHKLKNPLKIERKENMNTLSQLINEQSQLNS
ncbi:MAG: hypothetical protein AABX11_06110 [Nanoarchaeota archaeon]